MDQQWRQICETWKYVMAMKPEVRGPVEPCGISFFKSLVGWFLPENFKTWKLFLWLARSCFEHNPLLFASVFQFSLWCTGGRFHVQFFVSDWCRKWHARMWDKVMGPRGREWEKGGGGGVKERVMGAHQGIRKGFWSWSWSGGSDGRSTGEGGSRSRGATSPSSPPRRQDRGEAGEDKGAPSSPTKVKVIITVIIIMSSILLFFMAFQIAHHQLPRKADSVCLSFICLSAYICLYSIYVHMDLICMKMIFLILMLILTMIFKIDIITAIMIFRREAGGGQQRGGLGNVFTEHNGQS